jgi:hypothetical protein
MLTAHSARSLRPGWSSGRRPTASGFAFNLGDRMFVDAGEAHFHQPFDVELPVLVAKARNHCPLSSLVLVGEAHSDVVASEGPEFLD